MGVIEAAQSQAAGPAAFWHFHDRLSVGDELRQAPPLVVAYIWATVLLQRIALPIGEGYASPLVPLGLALAAWLYITRRARIEAVRAGLMTVAYVLILVASLVGIAGGADPSIPSLVLMLILYLPFALVLSAPGKPIAAGLLASVRSAASVIALLAIGQMFAQLAFGWKWSDLLATLVPSRFMVEGYVTSYPVTFGSTIYKSNGVLLLEPSLCSQILALGILAQIGLGRGRARIVLLTLALLTTASGTGLIVLIVGLFVYLVRRGAKQVVAALALALLLGAGVAISPLSNVYLDRITNSADPGSSGYQRFVAPWDRMGEALMTSPRTLLVGSGAGSGQDQVDRIVAAQGVPAIDTPQSKLVAEYGWPAAMLFVVFFMIVLVRGSTSPVIAASLATLYFLLGGNLLQAQTVLLVWTLTLPWVESRRLDPSFGELGVAVHEVGDGQG